jgi:hypothetical protein
LKTKPFILPVVALVGVVGWIGSQRQSIASIEQQSIVLRKQIANARAAGEDSGAAISASSRGKSVAQKKPINWKDVAAKMAEMRNSNGVTDVRAMMHMQQRIQEMSKDEILAALQEIAAGDLSAESKSMLEQMLLGPLVEKDPEMALNHFIDLVGDRHENLSWRLSIALKEWAEKDVTKAGSWFDAQIAAGKFDSRSLDGKSQSRLQFESSLVSILISSDLEAANLRVTALPEDQRSEVLGGFNMRSIKEKDHANFAELVRSTLPQKDQASSLSSLAGEIVGKGGYEKVTGYLDRINATPAEKTEVVTNTAESKIRNMSYNKTITREDIDSMREWVSSQAPESTDKVTGKALGNSIRDDQGIKFADAAALAQEYGQASGNDEVLASFLESQASRRDKNRAQARELAESIRDETRREKILSQLK